MSAKLPPSANVARATDGNAKLCAPAATRNAESLTTLLCAHAPRSGTALELASGTGQHAVAFARALPGLEWQPTDVAAERLSSIDAHAAEARLPNLRPARPLDATVAGWERDWPDRDLVVLVNLLHLIDTAGARTALTCAMAALRPGGRFILYGPFRRRGALTSAGDARFDAELRTADPAIGYKNDEDIEAWLRAAGAREVACVMMPANNLAFIATR